MSTINKDTCTLEELMDLVERDFPRSQGWDWLLRSNAPAGTYFANILKDQARVRYPVYGASRFDALLGAYNNALAGEH